MQRSAEEVSSNLDPASQQHKDTTAALKLKQAELNQKARIISDHANRAKQEQMKAFIDHMSSTGQTADARFLEVSGLYATLLYEMALKPSLPPEIIDRVDDSSDNCSSSVKRLKSKKEWNSSATPASLAEII